MNKTIKTIATVALVLAVTACTTGSVKTSGNETATFTNPLLPQGPDPWAICADSCYYYMHTLGDRLAIWKTNDITDLKSVEPVIVWTADSADATCNQHLWAPELHRIDGKWYIYYAADDGNTDNHQMYVLENEAEDPTTGHFTMKGRISTDPANNWAIDGSVFENDGKWYFVWSGWETRRVDVETQRIYIAQMKNPWTLATPRVEISKPEHEWERKYINPDGTTMDHVIYVNEGPQPLKSPDAKKIHIAYSASGCWTPYYALGLLTADADSDLLDPASWKKADKPVFQQSEENKVYGTGHCSFFTSPDGTESYILYHARSTQTDQPGKGDQRAPHCQKFTWTDDGYPQFGTPLPENQPLPKPSGTK